MDESKEKKKKTGFIFKDGPDVPPWVKEAAVRKIIWAANEKRDINQGPQGVHASENGVHDGEGGKIQEAERTAIRTGHHPGNVFEYTDPIRLSASHVDGLAKVNPKFAKIFHGNLAEPKLFVSYPVNPVFTKATATDNPLYFGNRKISAPQREKVKEGIYRIFDAYYAAGIIRRKGEKE